MGRQSAVTYAVFGALAAAALLSLPAGRWSLTLVALGTLALCLSPLLGARLAGIRLPRGFVACLALFLAATLMMGEFGNLYEHVWWWDVVLHAVSSVGLALIGAALALTLTGPARPGQPATRGTAAVAALLAFGFSVSMGVLWEVFEFALDSLFGFHTQRSGLPDTMSDMIVNCIGGAAGAAAGYAYLRGGPRGILARTLARFVAENRRLYRRR